jgi:periplasmic protein TonB
MGNQVLTPQELETETNPPAIEKPDPMQEADGSIWSSLISNLRDAFSSSKQPPLELSSQPVANDFMLAEQPVWKTLWANVQDALFPRKLPPLELTSTPIAVVDPMKVKRNPVSSSISFVAHAIIIGLIILFTIQRWRERAVAKKEVATDVDLKPYIPPTIKMNQSMGGGGGGGNHEIVEASKGKLPPQSKVQLAPPQILRIDHPKLAVEPTVVMPQQIKLPDTNMPNIGIPQSPQVALASQGGGSGSGFGSGKGGGIGSGNGNGVGPGTGGGYGGGLMRTGGGVSDPQLISSVDPEFSDEARRAKYQGICLVALVVDASGHPQNVHVVRPLGMGLDEKAIEAVKQYKFKPAFYQGHPVAVEIQVEVNFHIY